jgi:hypothetical protein
MTTIEQLAHETLQKYGVKEPDPRYVAALASRLQKLYDENTPALTKKAFSDYVDVIAKGNRPPAEDTTPPLEAQTELRRGRPPKGSKTVDKTTTVPGTTTESGTTTVPATTIMPATTTTPATTLAPTATTGTGESEDKMPGPNTIKASEPENGQKEEGNS